MDVTVSVLRSVLGVFAAMVALQVGCLRVLGGRSRHSGIWGTVSLAVGISGGSLLVWRLVETAPGGVVSPTLRIGGVCLFLAACIAYIELWSLLSRGYSLRILIDLLERHGAANMERLKAEYGDGAGIRGIVAKRLQTLGRLRLVYLHDRDVGPLTPLGRIFAAMGWRMRRVLRLESVG